ncbi:DUF7144 family membrane protein [Saccharopolyspora phatthalungensis]|uniref:Tryptophan-rich sensory protein n=1 Tax=Saccharopolyspora phatthalungensis TaxID=664693 RepID=A0A840QKC7_9PSEU|nr:hypothetical protein [Saccharopolyspora phatthalungensis]MBB5159785.1 tryptophan-rich sensory protein [Saccharopolyspora phatthalungensis]
MTSHNVPRGGIRTRWLGWVIFAGILLLLVGVVQLVHGIAAFSHSGTAVTQTGTLVTVDLSNVGWTYLILGIVLAAAGIGVMFGRMWARVIAIILAVLSLLANIAFFTAYPVWSTIAIVLDVVVIYALVAHGREAKRIR